jgi:hypothetical protein
MISQNLQIQEFEPREPSPRINTPCRFEKIIIPANWQLQFRPSAENATESRFRVHEVSSSNSAKKTVLQEGGILQPQTSLRPLSGFSLAW